MLDPVDETFFEYVDTCLHNNQVQTPQLQRKFAALGGIDLVVRLVAMSMNDEVIIKASRALSTLLQIEGNVGDSSLNSTPRSTSHQTPRTAAASSAGPNNGGGANGGSSGLSISSVHTRRSASVSSVASSASGASNTYARSHALVNAIKICAAGGVAALIAQMRRSRNDRVLQESAGALKHLTRVYGNTKSLPDWEGVESIFQDVQDAYAVIVHLFKRSHSPFVHSEIAEMLHHISLLPEGKNALGEVGAIGALVQQCKSPGQQQRSVVTWICTALCVLVMDDENRSHFTEADGPGALLDLMRRVPATSLAADMEWDEVIVGAAHALSNYMAGTGRMVHHYQTKVDEAGGAQELIKRCWGGIGGGGGGVAPTMGGVSSAGGLPSAPAGIISATFPQPTPLSPQAGGARSPMMSPHGAGAGIVRIKERLVEQCCGALCNLSCENDLMRIKLGELGACGLLTSVCRLCDIHSPSQKRILEQACAAIGNICKRNRSNRCKMSAVYGPETLVQVLGRARLAGADADGVARQALRAAANVAMRNEENQQRLADAGCCQHLVQYCFAVRDDALLNWVLAALGALAQDEVIKYRLVNEGALAAAAAAENSARSEETKEALKRLAAQLPLPTPVLGSVILKEEDEEVYLEADDDTWVPARTSLLYDRAGAVTSLSARFVQHCRSLGHQIKDVHAANAGDGIDRRKSPPGLTRIRLKVRDRSVTVDAHLNSSQEHDILLGPVVLAKLKTLGFEHMVNEYISF